jgi:hypothetical protein
MTRCSPTTNRDKSHRALPIRSTPGAARKTLRIRFSKIFSRVFPKKMRISKYALRFPTPLRAAPPLLVGEQCFWWDRHSCLGTMYASARPRVNRPRSTARDDTQESLSHRLFENSTADGVKLGRLRGAYFPEFPISSRHQKFVSTAGAVETVLHGVPLYSAAQRGAPGKHSWTNKAKVKLARRTGHRKALR